MHGVKELPTTVTATASGGVGPHRSVWTHSATSQAAAPGKLPPMGVRPASATDCSNQGEACRPMLSPYRPIRDGAGASGGAGAQAARVSETTTNSGTSTGTDRRVMCMVSFSILAGGMGRRLGRRERNAS